jgi:hypothetical protein
MRTRVFCAAAVAVAAAAAALTAVHPGIQNTSATADAVQPDVAVTPSRTASPPPAPVQFGLFQDTNNLQYSFPVTPNYAVQYYGWPEVFQTADVQAAWNEGTESFLELQSCGNPCSLSNSTSLSDIVAGKWDAYLDSFADAINAFGHPVLLTFDHEMNGLKGYPWNVTDGGVSTGVTPADWIAAWDHVTSVISSIAGQYVTWVWAPDVESYANSFAPYWPGTAGGPGENVGMVGLDGYLGAGATWANTIASSVSAIKQLSGDQYPFAITETGVDPSESNATDEITDLITNVRSAGGFVIYFDSGNWVMTSAMQATFIQDANPSPVPGRTPPAG